MHMQRDMHYFRDWMNMILGSEKRFAAFVCPCTVLCAVPAFGAVIQHIMSTRVRVSSLQ